jgi:NAD(P)-dependent dehydrogenase (short-subunit alcohol dehydrogenase family)
MADRDSAKYLHGLFGLSGKVAVVIGGTGVLCGAMGEGLYQAGCKVCLVGRDESKAAAHIESWGASNEDAMFQAADVASRKDLEAVLEAVLAKWGQVDIWINGAGVNSATPFFEVSDDEFQQILDVNLKAVHMGCQIIAQYWLDKGYSGNIINISSISALQPLSRVFTYSLTKAAVWNLTKNLAREWGEKGIRVNALCPGFFPAEQNRKILDKSRVDAIMDRTPMNRFGEKEELVGAVLLLASDVAGSFMTGSHLVVDGGFSIKCI